MRITKEVAQELIDALDESREKISKEAEEILKKMAFPILYASYVEPLEDMGLLFCCRGSGCCWGITACCNGV